MSILVNADSRILVQGLTGREGQLHARQMLDYGTNIVAGCTPGKGGMEVLGVPVFNTCAEAVKATGADVSIIFVPSAAAADSACAAAAAGIKLVVLITEHIPVLDMVRAKAFLNAHGTRLIGPNCPGIITPGACKLGIMPGYIFKPGPIGLVIGNEGNGVSRLIREKCDYIASIPMKGDIDSLNASVAAGVLAYEIVRQRLG